jgi:hypothetical protein
MFGEGTSLLHLPGIELWIIQSLAWYPDNLQMEGNIQKPTHMETQKNILCNIWIFQLYFKIIFSFTFAYL